mmetsp:Transcript_43942/g.139146  ORF Transcript_43942/g.139146 Transcript_43942/m.139146 type:complete len:541 (-) Transcript_43942:515-2137(-)
MWPMDIAAWLCASGDGEESWVSSATCPPTCSSASADAAFPPSRLHSVVRHIVWTAASCEKSICPTTVSAPLWHSGPTADGTKERLATAERAQCCTCGCGEDSSPARGPMAPASGRTCRKRSSAANCAMACTAWYEVSTSSSSSAARPGSPPSSWSDCRSEGWLAIEAMAAAAGPLASALEEESIATRCGSTDGCCSCAGVSAPAEQRLPKVMAAYARSSWFGCSSSCSVDVRQPFSTIACACTGSAESCESADRACSCARSSPESSCSESRTRPPDSKSCSAFWTSPGQRLETRDVAKREMRPSWWLINWMRCGTAPTLRTARCAWVRPESASRLRHSRTAATTSLLPVPGERSIAARGEAAPASSSASAARPKAQSCWARARAARCTSGLVEPRRGVREVATPESAACSRHSLCEQSIASRVRAASCSEAEAEPSMCATEKTAPFCCSCFQSPVGSSHKLARTRQVASCSGSCDVLRSTSSTMTSPLARRTSLLPLFEAVREARADIALTLLSVPPERTSARIASRSSRSSCSSSRYSS